MSVHRRLPPHTDIDLPVPQSPPPTRPGKALLRDVLISFVRIVGNSYVGSRRRGGNRPKSLMEWSAAERPGSGSVKTRGLTTGNPVI